MKKKLFLTDAYSFKNQTIVWCIAVRRCLKFYCIECPIIIELTDIITYYIIINNTINISIDNVKTINMMLKI